MNWVKESYLSWVQFGKEVAGCEGALENTFQILADYGTLQGGPSGLGVWK